MDHTILAVSSNIGTLILSPVGGKVEKGPTGVNKGERKESVSYASGVAAGCTGTDLRFPELVMCISMQFR